MISFDFLFAAGKVLFIFIIMMQVPPIMLWLERRGSAWMQNRQGPNRVGPFGLLIALADAIKFIFKEEMIPGHVSKFYYVLAPIIAVVPAFMTFAVIPFAGPIEVNGNTYLFQIANLDVGTLYILSVASLGVFGVIMAGWAANNKYALLGALRSSSQMISYELSLGLSVAAVVLTYSSVRLGDMVVAQSAPLFHIGSIVIPRWGILLQPLGFLIFITAAYAETNRLPFDLPEGESEIIAGYHLEYGALKFAIMMMAELLNMLTASGLLASFFFGGYHFPGLEAFVGGLNLNTNYSEWVRAALQAAVFFTKVGFFMWLFVWVRWTLPRFRYDQLMSLGWKVMFPLALINIFITGSLIYFGVF